MAVTIWEEGMGILQWRRNWSVASNLVTSSSLIAGAEACRSEFEVSLVYTVGSCLAKATK